MNNTEHKPNINRISVLSSAILLAYTLAGFITLPSRTLSIQFPGLFLEFPIDKNTIVSFLVALLAATGADSLVRDHKNFTGKLSIQHWFLPALTAWAIGLILLQEPFSFLWWIVFSIGGLTLVLVLFAEFIVVDAHDIRRIPATIGLIALSFSLFLVLAITIRSIELRIFILTPAISIAAGLVSLRTLHLLYNQWAIIEALVIAIIMGQISAALNYLRIDPITFGLFLLAPTYALTSLTGGLLAKRSIQQVILEPLIVLIIVWSIAIFLR